MNFPVTFPDASFDFVLTLALAVLLKLSSGELMIMGDKALFSGLSISVVC